MNWIQRDLKAFWHPCSQMKDYETFQPLLIKKTYDSYLELESGQKIIDAVSSWWCKALGHQHPRLRSALIRQAEQYDHVIAANTCQKPLVELSERLIELDPHFGKVLYASDGSCAVEMALKLSLHSRFIKNQTHKCQIMALENGYHGETIMTLAVSDLGIYKDAYKPWMFETSIIKNIPYVCDSNDPLWQNCSEHWHSIAQFIESHAQNLTAIVLEPIVQGAGGMKIYSADFLKRLGELTQHYDIHLIADEIMTGFYRTGKMFAYQHADIHPDFICLGKGLTGGWLPLSGVLLRDSIYQLFYDDYLKGKNFLHSHTHSGNILAAAVALEALNIMSEPGFEAGVNNLHTKMYQNLREIAEKTQLIKNVRGIGGIVAADLKEEAFQHIARPGFALYQEAVQLGALLRPLGSTFYWLPPLTTDESTITELAIITEKALMNIHNQLNHKMAFYPKSQI